MEPKYFNDYSMFETKHWWFIGRRRILKCLLLRFLKKKTTNFLDIGCGTGKWIKKWAEKQAVFGVDMYLPILKECKSSGLKRVTQGVLQCMPLKNDSFGCITLLDVLEHIDDEDLALEEVKRVAKPDAIVMLTVPAFSFLWGSQDLVSHHKRRYTVKDIISLMQKHGFAVMKVSCFNTILFPIIFVIRTYRLMKRGETKELDKINSDFEINKGDIINTFLSVIFSLERFMLPYVSLPLGVSIVCIAKVVK